MLTVHSRTTTINEWLVSVVLDVLADDAILPVGFKKFALTFKNYNLLFNVRKLS
jgi:hypothetical protein